MRTIRIGTAAGTLASAGSSMAPRLDAQPGLPGGSYQRRRHAFRQVHRARARPALVTDPEKMKEAMRTSYANLQKAIAYARSNGVTPPWSK